MGIGKEGQLPWPMLKADMKHFAQVTSSNEPMGMNVKKNAAKSLLFNSMLKKNLTDKNDDTSVLIETQNAIVMGRKTWESIPKERRPLKDRLNVILTKQSEYDTGCQGRDNVQVFPDFDQALTTLSGNQNVNEIFVIGGSSLYTMAMTSHKENCKLIIATRVNKEFECDVNVPDLEKSKDFEPMHVSQTQS